MTNENLDECIMHIIETRFNWKEKTNANETKNAPYNVPNNQRRRSIVINYNFRNDMCGKMAK